MRGKVNKCQVIDDYYLFSLMTALFSFGNRIRLH